MTRGGEVTPPFLTASAEQTFCAEIELPPERLADVWISVTQLEDAAMTWDAREKVDLRVDSSGENYGHSRRGPRCGVGSFPGGSDQPRIFHPAALKPAAKA